MRLGGYVGILGKDRAGAAGKGYGVAEAGDPVGPEGGRHALEIGEISGLVGKDVTGDDRGGQDRVVDKNDLGDFGAGGRDGLNMAGQEPLEIALARGFIG